jgi:hypothetical protein
MFLFSYAMFWMQCSYFHILNPMFLFYFHMQYFVKSVGRVTKSMCHLFWTDMSHMSHAYEMWRSRIIPFWTASEWVTERGIYDEPRVWTRFRCHNPVVLRCPIVGCAIGEHWDYAVEAQIQCWWAYPQVVTHGKISWFKCYIYECCHAKRDSVVRSDIEVFIEHHWGPDPSNPDQLCSQSTTDALVSCHHFSMFCTVVLPLTYISVFLLENGKETVRLHGEGVN